MAKAKEEIEQEMVDKEEEKERYLAERAPALQTGGMSFAELQVLPSIHTFNKPVDCLWSWVLGSSLLILISPIGVMSGVTCQG